MAAKIPKVPTRNSVLNNTLSHMDDIFEFEKKEKSPKVVTEPRAGELVEMEFDRMESFPGHKFKLYTGQRLQDMINSIREFGILEPLILWKHEEKLTILSGHNRENAAKLAGHTKGPVIIKENLSYEDAVLIVTETNLRQRSFADLSYSERAFCLKQHYDAIKSQGRRNDLLKEIEDLMNPHEIKENPTLLENPTKLRSDEKVGDEYGLSRDKIVRYLRIATLTPSLLDYLDTKRLGFEAAYDISFVKEAQQFLIAEMIEKEGFTMDTKKSALLHSYAKSGSLTDELIRQIVSGERARKPKSNKAKPIQIKGTVITKYFTEKQSRKEIEETIEKALDLYFAERSTEQESKVG